MILGLRRYICSNKELIKQKPICLLVNTTNDYIFGGATHAFK